MTDARLKLKFIVGESLEVLLDIKHLTEETTASELSCMLFKSTWNIEVLVLSWVESSNVYTLISFFSEAASLFPYLWSDMKLCSMM